MALASENTVSAENQMKNSGVVFYLGDPKAKTRLLILGNSITRHGPKEEIGWSHDWGMAATAKENDYVHRLFARLQADGKDVFVMVRQASDWEMNYKDPKILSGYEEEKAFGADVLLFRLGENVQPPVDEAYFYGKLCEFVKYLCKAETKVLPTTCNLANPPADRCIEKFAAEENLPCVRLGEISTKPGMTAVGQFWHEGVQMHPSDAGMAAIEEAIYEELKVLL